MNEKIFNLQRFAKKVKLTKKADTYSNTTSSRIIYALAGNDSIYSSADKVTVSGGAGNDTLAIGGASSVSLSGDAGNDYLYAYRSSVYSSSYYATLSGGAGNDTIYSDEIDKATLSGGSGNDYISSSNSSSSSYGSVSSSSYYVTLNGGKGDDIINLSGDNHILQYASGDGNDIVLGFNPKDTLHITKGNYSVKTDENDVIVTIGDGKITLKGAAGQKISIKNSKGKVTKKTYGSAGLFAEDNFVENELESIIENKSPAVLEDFKNTDMENLAAKTSLTSGFDGGEN